jgi:hypothetical protein
MRKTLLIGALAALGGCGGDSGSAFEGIYVFTEWTQNTQACTEGPSILENAFETAMVVRYESFFGTSFLHSIPCADLAECDEFAAEEDTLYLSGHFFDRGGDGDGWRGDEYNETAFVEGSCQGLFKEVVLTGEAGSTVRIEIEFFPTDQFPEDEDGFCDLEMARDAAQETCTGLEVLTASFDHALP